MICKNKTCRQGTYHRHIPAYPKSLQQPSSGSCSIPVTQIAPHIANLRWAYVFACLCVRGNGEAVSKRLATTASSYCHTRIHGNTASCIRTRDDVHLRAMEILSVWVEAVHLKLQPVFYQAGRSTCSDRLVIIHNSSANPFFSDFWTCFCRQMGNNYFQIILVWCFDARWNTFRLL